MTHKNELRIIDVKSERRWLSRVWKQRSEVVAAVSMWSAALLVVGVLAWILLDILVKGFTQLSIPFLIEEPVQTGRGGGISTVIISTLLILVVTLVVAVPLSFASAIALAEQSRKGSRFARIIRRCLDVLAAIPSIVFGLFGNAFFCVFLGMGYSILAGGLTLACMILPILTRITEQGIRAVPDHYRYGAASLGLSQTTTLFRIVLPSAAPSIAAGLVLGIGRALAETAALIYTSGIGTRSPESLFDSGRALSVHVYFVAMNVPGGDSRAYATATVLISMLLVINIVAMSLTQWASRQTDGALLSGDQK